ncbi:hypothetical protein GGR57DRAFT_459372 [Xylariaceae sp. FL1272]|nr:hypothetical protein GGR57DRAFT_459372 [Xylariaceae sp. FL1272]
MAPPFRNDHIGSLLRPKSLLDARSALSSPSQMYSLEIPESVKAAQLKAIQDVAALQISKGVRSITDGEYARHIYYGGFFEKLSGFEARPTLRIPDAFRTDFPTTTKLKLMGATTRAACVCTGKIQYKESPYLAEWLTLHASLPEELIRSAKITLPAPTYQHIQLKPGTAYTAESGYTSDEAYFADIASCYAAELKTLYDAGVRNIQIDDPHLTYFASSQFLDGCKKDGTNTDELLNLYISVHNQLLKGKPKDLHMGVHLCRGNMAGSVHWVDGSYENIAQKLFCETDYETYYLEFDDVERVGGFEPLRFLPKGKNLVLGLISTKDATLENGDKVKEKIFDAAGVIAKAQGLSEKEALDCLALSPQCGFSSSSLSGGLGMTEGRMWEKLELVKRVADEVWG